VNDAVNAASDWKELAAVLESKGSLLDAEHISAIMRKV
jgi:hypothetical protein